MLGGSPSWVALYSTQRTQRMQRETEKKQEENALQVGLFRSGDSLPGRVGFLSREYLL